MFHFTNVTTFTFQVLFGSDESEVENSQYVLLCPHCHQKYKN